MPLFFHLPKATAMTLWSLLGFALLLAFEPRTDAACGVTILILAGQIAIAALFFGRRRPLV